MSTQSSSTSPLEQHTEAVTRVLDQRGEVYSPDAHHDRHAQARLYQRVKAALYAELPADLPDGAQYYIDMMAAKVSRSFESACAGIPNTDSPFDFAGYTELLTRMNQP